MILLKGVVVSQNYAPKDSYPNETIRDYLLRDYDKYTRPNNANFTIKNKAGEDQFVTYAKVYFAFYLMWLSELDCSASNFKGNFYVIYEWDDYRLRFTEDVFKKGNFQQNKPTCFHVVYFRCWPTVPSTNCHLLRQDSSEC